ncbi:MAG: energy-coupling factor ABC transporter permease [Candidatus Omnitrophica bacterium]|nr:energy-coupling factor ABC transporter permease [Candidatus Omnitrophota bacterium]
MHIPDSMLHGAVCPVTLAVGAAGVAVAARAASRSESKPTSARFAAITALILAAQMINFPVASGTSGHLVGGVLAAALLGIPFAVLSMTTVLAIQAFLFADGGMFALGANVINMALIGAGAGGWIYQRISKDESLGGAQSMAGLALASWISVFLAAGACSVELAWSGAAEWSAVLPAMAGIHALIGLSEAVLTVGLAWALTREPAVRQPVLVPLAAAFVVAVLLSPFASRLPDGLETVARQLGIL